ncbi:unnamed protein product [Echinostoma caproni]|uniref:CUB domain-containing protein n=1 Tax=Echinostoma caproni TaxID=27848 RepID=A0A183B702_9TREM|nr:unnamed protein product [Echinostoma caproni]
MASCLRAPVQFWDDPAAKPSAEAWNSWKTTFTDYLDLLCVFSPAVQLTENDRIKFLRHYLGQEGAQSKLTEEQCGTFNFNVDAIVDGWTVPPNNKKFTTQGTCEYTITGVQDKKYQITFSNFKLGSTEKQCGDTYLQISDDETFTEEKPAKLCGSEIPTGLPPSTGHVMHVKLSVGATAPGEVTFTANVKQGGFDFNIEHVDMNRLFGNPLHVLQVLV